MTHYWGPCVFPRCPGPTFLDIGCGSGLFSLPAGLDYDDDDHVIITPDQAVREAVTCVFRRFDQLGSARQVVVSLRADGLRLPRRDIRTGKIAWAPLGG